MTKKLYVIMHDETQTVCPTEAESPDEARTIIGEMLGKDVSHCVVYDTSKAEDVDAVIAIVANHLVWHPYEEHKQ